VTRDQARIQINTYVEEAYASIKKAEAVADTHGISFDFNLGYGMGGTYSPKRPMTRDEALKLVESGQTLTDTQRAQVVAVLRSNPNDSDDAWSESSYYEPGWNSSSSMC